MNIFSNIKKVYFFLVLITIATMAILGILMWSNNWNVNYLFNEKVIPLGGTLETEDGYMMISPKEMVLNHKGIILRVDYELAETLKEKGFYMNAFDLPRLMLEKNPDDHDWFGSSVFAPGVTARTAYTKTDDEDFYLEYFYAFKDLDYQEGDTLQLNFYSANFGKEINERFSLELNQWTDVEIDELAEYGIRIIRLEDDIKIESKLQQKLGDSMRIYDQVISIVGDQEMRTGAGGGTGSGHSNYFSFSGKYEVEPFFWEGEYYVHLHELTMDIGPYYERYPRLRLIEGSR